MNLDGIRAEEVREILADEVSDELRHSRQLAERINKELEGTVEGSMDSRPEQQTSQPQADTTDLGNIKGILTINRSCILYI